MITTIDGCGQGFNNDLTPEELGGGVWTRVKNMRFSNGYAERFKGMLQVFNTPAVVPYFITSYATTDKRYWIHAGVSSVFADDGTTRTNITPSSVPTGAVDNRYTGGTLNGVFVLNNGVDNPWYWGGVSNMQPLPGWNANWKADVIRPFKNFLIALGMTKPYMALTTSSITRVGTTATLTTSSAHGLLTGQQVVIAGATPSQYNGTYTITTTGISTFTYVMAGDPGGVATVVGTLTGPPVKYPHMIKWSDIAVPGAIPSSWDETNPALDAGELDCAETADLLVDAMPMGDSLVIYKERSSFQLTYVGAPYIFRLQRLPGESGMLASGCGVNTPYGHVVLTAGDIVLNTGQGVNSIANGLVREFVFKNIDSTNYKRAFVTANPQRNEVWVCFPYGTSQTCNKAVVWNWLDKSWAIRDLTNVTYGAFGQINYASTGTTWGGATGTWSTDAASWNENDYSPAEARLITCHSTPYIALVDTGTSDFGSLIESTLERTGISLGDFNGVKTVRGIRPRIDGNSGAQVSIQIGASMYPDSGTIWQPAQTFTVGQSIKVDSFATGRYISVRFSNVDYAPWRMKSFDIDWTPAGAF